MNVKRASHDRAWFDQRERTLMFIAVLAVSLTGWGLYCLAAALINIAHALAPPL